MAVGTILLRDSGVFSFHIADGKKVREFDRSKFYERNPDVIWFAAACPDLMIYEIEIPGGVDRKNIELILGNELSYRLPLELEDVRWGYRHGPDNRFLVYVLTRKRFDSILTVISKNDFTCDFFCPLPQEKVPDEQDRIIPVSLSIPKENRPVRNRTSRILYFLLLLLSLAMFGSILWEKYGNFQREYNNLKSMTSNKGREFKQIQDEFGKLSAEKELSDQISGLGLNLDSLMPTLCELNVMLPKHMWITNYVQHSNVIDITIQSSQDEPNFFRHLSSAKTFKIVNLRKSRGGNSTVIFYAKLKGGFR